MATYVFSDVHGHLGTLERMFDRVSPSEGDRIFMLGDMIDRGPDPVGVLKFCRDLQQNHGATVLMGNHEDLMLAFFADPHGPDAYVNWAINGGLKTAEGLEKLEEDEIDALLEWTRGLPLCASARVGDRLYFFSHAGLNRKGGWVAPVLDEDADDAARIAALTQDQEMDDLVWVRHEFWGRPTGLVGPDGRGIIAIAGHTPTPYLDDIADRPDRPGRGEDGLGQMVRVGAREETGGVADRWDIDSGCAGGYGFGKLLLLRLDDGEEFYEPVREGE